MALAPEIVNEAKPHSQRVNILSQPDAVTLDGKQTNIWVVDSNFRMQSLAYKKACGIATG